MLDSDIRLVPFQEGKLLDFLKKRDNVSLTNLSDVHHNWYNEYNFLFLGNAELAFNMLRKKFILDKQKNCIEDANNLMFYSLSVPPLSYCYFISPALYFTKKVYSLVRNDVDFVLKQVEGSFFRIEKDELHANFVAPVRLFDGLVNHLQKILESNIQLSDFDKENIVFILDILSESNITEIVLQKYD